MGGDRFRLHRHLPGAPVHGAAQEHPAQAALACPPADRLHRYRRPRPCRATAAGRTARAVPAGVCTKRRAFRPARPGLLPTPVGRHAGSGALVPLPPQRRADRLEPVLRARRQAGGQVHRPVLSAVARPQPVLGQLDAQPGVRLAARPQPLRRRLDRFTHQGRTGCPLHFHRTRGTCAFAAAARRPAQAGPAPAG
ncbi:hypothetical protein D3C73_1203360 [compost metagenome]